MNMWIANQDVWGLAQLEERNAMLMARALQIWSYPETEYMPAEKQMDFCTLDDETDLTGRTIAKFAYKNVVQPVESWIEMFERMLRMLHHEDKSLLRNQTAMEISRICGMTWTPAMISVEVYLNNEYLGIYTFCENKEVAKNRVDIDLDKGDVYLELEQFMDNPVCFWTTHRLPVMFSDPEEPSNELKENIIQRFRDFENVLYSENFADPETGYAPMIDVESVINYYIIQELTKNIDGNLRKSTFITLGPDSPLKFYHVWDFDRALGNCYYFPSEYPGTTNDYTGWFIKDQTLEHNEGWFARFFKDPAFVSGLQQKWAEVYPQLRNVPSDFIDVKARELDKAQQRNFQKWQILGTETYRDKVLKMRDFYMKRLEWLNSEIPKLD